MESKKEESQEKKDQQPQSDQPIKTEPNTSTNPTNQSQITKSPKPRKIQYLNQKVYFPVNIPDKIEFIHNLF